MTIQAWIALLFISGIVLQWGCFTRGAGDRKFDLLLLAGFIIAGGLLSLSPSGEPVYMGLLQSFFVSPLLLAALHREEILPRVSEKALLSCAITFWFMFFSSYYTGAVHEK